MFGPGRDGAQLEGSKAFTKALCAAKAIPTAAFGHFGDRGRGACLFGGQPLPIVIKADGLAAGKGVVSPRRRAEAEDAVKSLL